MPYKPINDAGSYLTIASYVARTGDYSLKTTPGSGAGGTRGPSAYFAPGFPYFLGLVDLIDGHAVRRGPAIQPVRDSQAVLGTITVALVGLVAFELFGATAGLIALLLAAVYPVFTEEAEHHRGREPADPAGARGPLHSAPGPPGGLGRGQVRLGGRYRRTGRAGHADPRERGPDPGRADPGRLDRTAAPEAPFARGTGAAGRR